MTEIGIVFGKSYALRTSDTILTLMGMLAQKARNRISFAHRTLLLPPSPLPSTIPVLTGQVA